MQTCTYTVAEVHVVNGFMSHSRNFEDIADVLEYCRHLISYNIIFDIYDPEMELRFNQDDLDSIEEYFELETDEKTSTCFLLEYQDMSLEDALRNFDNVVNYGSTSREDIIFEQLRDGCFGNIDSNLVDFINIQELTEAYGEELIETNFGVFSF